MNASNSLKVKLGINESATVVLGIASTWNRCNGLDDFMKLREMITDAIAIVLVDINDKQIAALTKGVIGIKRTESVVQLAELYSLADVFVNPAYVGYFQTTNIEALACVAPLVTYRTGSSPETIDKTGKVRQIVQ